MHNEHEHVAMHSHKFIYDVTNVSIKEMKNPLCSLENVTIFSLHEQFPTHMQKYVRKQNFSLIKQANAHENFF